MYYRRVLWCFITIFVAHRAIVVGNEVQTNVTRPYTIQLTRVICVGMPYEETIVNVCRVILRRNQRSLISMSVYVPKVYNFLLLQYRLHYKYTTYRQFLIDGELEVCAYMRGNKAGLLEQYIHDVLSELLSNTVYPCPHGNKTYVEKTEFKEEYAPKSIPAGEYRMDLRFANRANVTLLWVQAFATVRRKGIMGSMLEW